MGEYCWLDTTKKVAEILGFFGAAGFFGYKLLAGYLMVNAGISAKLERSMATETDDYLTVSATVKKGSQGSLNVHDVRALFSWSGGSKEVELVGFNRLSYKTDNGETQRKRAVFGKTSKSSPFLRLTTDEEATFSGMAQVPRKEPCTVEVVVLGIRKRGRKVGQWRTSVISIPKERSKERA